nr:RnfABCDGE type electron transport complex subunit C [Melioribacteraceae bacterium]
ILNGCECEPYLTRDNRLMIERTEEVLKGLVLIMRALNVSKGAIGIEDNKPEAIHIMKQAVSEFNNITVEVVKTKYPQGAEKMLIKAVTGKEVPPGKLPMDVGVVIQNISTSVAVYDAVVKGEPLTIASLTVSGLGVKEPKNLLVPVGTTLADVLEYCGGVKENASKVVVGGPMMGVAQYDFNAPIMKATSGILVLTEEEVNNHEETPCLRCGMCVGVCPLGLEPTRLAKLSQLDKLEEAENLGITVCMECGTCTYTCPANIPLVQWIRLGKQRVLKLQRDRKTV